MNTSHPWPIRPDVSLSSTIIRVLRWAVLRAALLWSTLMSCTPKIKHVSYGYRSLLLLDSDSWFCSVWYRQAGDEKLCVQVSQVRAISCACINYVWLIFALFRDANDIFAVNAIHFHQKNTYASVGSDGVISFWDKEARHRLSHLEQFKRQCPITDVKFNAAVREFPSRVFYILFVVVG